MGCLVQEQPGEHGCLLCSMPRSQTMQATELCVDISQGIDPPLPDSVQPHSMTGSASELMKTRIVVERLHHIFFIAFLRVTRFLQLEFLLWFRVTI